MTLVILAAGMGSRYGGMKQIDPMGPSGEFIIDYSCFDAIRAGFDKIVFVIKRENLDAFRASVGCRVEPYADVKYVFQDLNDLPEGFTVPAGRVKPWGTAHALLAAKNVVTDNFATINADDFYGFDAFRVIADKLRAADPAASPMPFFMAGYRLNHTLTENGTVSRGICRMNADGTLLDITERTAIRPKGADAEFCENDVWTDLPGDAVASMNFFGLTPGFFPFIEEQFRVFLAHPADPMKSEFYLPVAVSLAMNAELASVEICRTNAKWYGVTYADDKQKVKASIAALIEKGEYAADLWSALRK